MLVLGTLVISAVGFKAQGQTDWPNYSHDAGGTRYSPLKQINRKNVAKLKLAWTFDTTAIVAAVPRSGSPARPNASGASANAEADQSAKQGDGMPGAERPGGHTSPVRVRVRQSKSTPLVVGDTMYFSTPYDRVVALNAQTGAKIWEYVLPYSPASRGISYWPGEGHDAPEIFIGTSNGRLIALNATNGKLISGFGEGGILNVRDGVADKYPNNH
ncbi:PQQ-binding-like beta-propeller repeat protein, partial [Granulicella sp. L60]|uniref:outer membrane protein assembly factor BamB family protein n=1 Tax=Granulicella sp. L60 TaxID=1641866 RepID=UPI00131D1955